MELALLGVAALLAGFVDAVAGGGGLIQVPSLLIALPGESAAAVFGTNKGASVCGSINAAWRYGRRMEVPWRKVLLPAILAALVCSFLGAAVVSYLPRQILRPLVFLLLLGLFAYTWFKPDFGRFRGEMPARPLVPALLSGAVMGFYDGFFGPGTGSFLIFAFIRFFGFDFLKASACAKVVNVATNVAALLFFVPHGQILWLVAGVMAVCNVLGSTLGSRLALKHGSGFVRAAFLLVTAALLLKIALDMAGV